FVLQRAFFAMVISFLALSAIFYILPSLRFWRGVLVLVLAFYFVGQVAIRSLIRKFSSSSQFATRVLIVGAGELAKKIADIVPKDHNIHSFVRFISCTEKKPAVDPELIVGHISNIDELIQDYRPQKLVIALQERRGNLPLKKFMRSKLRGIDVLEATTYFEQEKGCLLIENMQPSAFVYTQGFRMTPLMRSYKRIYDIIFSAVGLFLAAPLFPVLAILIKLDSPGSVFYKQLRVGEREVEYFVYKFRTMAQDAEKSTGAVWAEKNDPRVTRIGQFLRKTRLDEIPQLLNVLKGEMSFIGPRPERMAFVERLQETIPFYSIRHFVKPGVTGWAQVCYPYGASDEDALEKMRYDLFYIKNYSILLDFRIIIDTIKVVVSGFGGR
ncbi:MAG: TIGR03013 family PEP-CTERM/XrtA system glycosyltransferase, partial [Desulfuromusa sp.]|nr:TIGR03013 family PEP-CTERM/XrtA system glycosyltransferase [Desulfuromusa sp.]